ncbi:MAG: PAS domain S-box protein, partial [Candidatus Hydrogenedentales bacterium]
MTKTARRKEQGTAQPADSTMPPAFWSALREREERLRRVIETVRDAIITLDGERGIIIGWNPGAETIFGYGEDET